MKLIRNKIVLASAVLGLFATDLFACVKRDATASDSVVVKQLSATTWRVLASGYTTEAAASGAYCAVGLAVPASGRISSVDSVALIGANASTMPAFEWSSNAAVGTAFNAVKAGNWSGFLGKTTAAVAAGTKCVYDFVVTVSSGTTLTQLTTDLQASDLGSDAATATGSLAGGALQSVFRIATVTEQVLYRNGRTFHNDAYSNLSTRATVDSVDSLIFMQPRDFRRGQGDASGWTVRLQDQDASTAESVDLGFVAYSGASADTPDLTGAGVLTKVSYTLFGTGSGSQATVYTLTTTLGVPLPEYSGIRIDLPKPAKDFPADGVTVAVQDGDTTDLPSAQRVQWTYVASGTTATALRPSGSTMHLGGLYDCGVTRAASLSSAYGSSEVLMGAESIGANATAGERTVFRLESAKYPSTVALLLIAGDYGPAKMTSHKIYFLPPYLLSPTVITNAQGVGTASFRVPPSVQIAAQAIFFNFAPTVEYEFGDACRVNTR